jgi:hypothetical protein
MTWRFCHDEGGTAWTREGLYLLRVEHNGTDFSWEVLQGGLDAVRAGTAPTQGEAMVAAEHGLGEFLANVAKVKAGRIQGTK